jgi:peptide/nickel transport system substrate-binding protein
MQTQLPSLYLKNVKYQFGGGTSNPDISSKVQQIPDVLRMGDLDLYGGPISLDPLIRAYVGPHSLTYEPLVGYNWDKNEIVPNLAYQWVVTNDSKHWTFYLREDILFHDGSLFNAQAVKFSFERTLNMTGSSLWSYAEMPLESVEIVNDFQVIFHFNESYSPFIHRDAQIFLILSPNSFDGSNLTSPIGTGPYKIDVNKSNSTFLHYTRFEQYHGGLAPFKEVHFTLYPLSEIDRYHNDADDHKLDYCAIGIGIDSSEDPYWNTSYTDGSTVADVANFNLNNSYLANENVRKAINYAIDNREWWADPLRSILPPGYLWHDPSVEGYPYNPELANTLLDEEGFTRGEANIRFSLKVITSNFWEDLIQLVAASLEEIGISCEVESLSPQVWETRWHQGDYDLSHYSVFDYDSGVINALLHSKGIHNTGGFENETIDLLTKLSQQTPVRQERQYYYQVVQQLAQEECPYLLLTSYPLAYYRAQHLTPYFYLSGKARFIFNYTNSDNHYLINSPNFKFKTTNTTDQKILTDITVAEQAMYFPITDAIITNPNTEPLKVTLKMSHQLTTFLPTQNATGKFYQIETDNAEVYYRFRSYYDPEEVENKSLDRLAFFEYDEVTETWRELETIASNTSLSYVEIKLKGGERFLRLDESIEEFVQLTYRLLPVISIFTILMIVIIAATITKNQQVAKYVKNKYG